MLNSASSMKTLKSFVKTNTGYIERIISGFQFSITNQECLIQEVEGNPAFYLFFPKKTA